VSGWPIAESLDFNQFVGVAFGALIGGFIGTLAGDRIKKFLGSRRSA